MIRKLKWIALPLASGMLIRSGAVPVQATEPEITISIDQKQITLEELQASDYEVPVFVRLDQNVDLNAIEFGLKVDSRCRFEVVTKTAYSQLYGEELGINMVSATTSGIDGYTWLTWMQQTPYTENHSNLVMLLITVPESASPGDVYPIDYLTQSPSNPDKQEVWFNFDSNQNYASTGSVERNDGFIEITGQIDYIPGDVNQDGKVSIRDVIMLNKAILGKLYLTDIQEKAADLDGDNIPSSTDSLIILKMIVGLI